MISHKYPINQSATYWTVDKLLDSRKFVVNCQSNEDEK